MNRMIDLAVLISAVWSAAWVLMQGLQ